HDHGRDQRQGQITMRDRAAERTFTFGALDVDMDPLAIAGAGRECIDAVLIERDPFGRAELTAGELRRGRHGILGHARTYDSPRRSLRRILPTFDFGNASRKRISLGTLYAASWRRQCAINSASVSVAPGLLATNSRTASPVFSSGLPTQAHSATPATQAEIDSTS